MRPNDSRAGFTLVEVLAALVVTAALVAVVLPYAGRLATRWWVGETAVETADGWMQGLARLGDDLSQAVPLRVPLNGKPVLAFSAGPEFVQFVRPGLGAEAARLDIVRFDVRTTAGGGSLVRRQRRFAPESFFMEGSGFGRPASLIEGPFRFRFRTIDSDNVPRTHWAGGETMPVGVELSAVATARASTPPAPTLFSIVARASRDRQTPQALGTAEVTPAR